MQASTMHSLNCYSTISAGEVVEAEVEVTAKRAGYCVVISSFECKEMGDIQGQCTVEVKRK